MSVTESLTLGPDKVHGWGPLRFGSLERPYRSRPLLPEPALTTWALKGHMASYDDFWA
jgi:hypothetical protein